MSDKPIAGDYDILTRALEAAEARCVELKAENEALRAEVANWEATYNGDGKTISGLIDLAGEDKAQIEALRDLVREARLFVAAYGVLKEPLITFDMIGLNWRCQTCKQNGKHPDEIVHNKDCRWALVGAWLAKAKEMGNE